MATLSDETKPLYTEPLKGAVWIAAGFAGLSGLLLGYDTAITNGALQPLTTYFAMTHGQIELFVGMLTLMALPGCAVGGLFSEWFGRRASIAIGAIMFILGNLLMTLAMSYSMLMIGRAIVGVAVGLTLVVGPLYTAEISPARLRGMVATNVEISFNLGILMGFTSSWLLGELPDETSWRWMFGICLIAPVLSLIGVLYFLPESPRWLATQGRIDEAEEVLHRLLGPREASATLASLHQCQAAKVDAEMSWSTLLSSRKTCRLAFIGCAVAFFSQATGSESIMYYSGVILTDAGMTRSSMLFAMVIVGLFKLAALVFHACIVDRIGRRPLLMTSSVGMALSMALLASAFWLSAPLGLKVIPIIGFVVFFSVGFAPIVYTLNAELYPTSCRSKGLTLAMGTGRVVSAVVALTFLSLVERLTYGGAFFFYAFWGAASAFFVFLFVPETKGLALEGTIED